MPDRHEFWSTQPVPQVGENGVVATGPLDEPKTVDDISKVPYPIASSLEWWTPDLEKLEDMRAIYELLRDNYVEDDDSMFRFNYSVEFLQWALSPPGYVKDWHVAVRRKSDGKLLAFIAGVPITMHMGIQQKEAAELQKLSEDSGAAPVLYDAPRRICEINFLCVHKILRAKRLAPILIKEITRRVNLRDVWQAVYTAGVVLPTPFASGQYYHRSLNPEKLVAVRFSAIPTKFLKFQNPMAMLKRAFQLPDEPKTKNLRPMTAADGPQVCKLLGDYLSRFDVYPIFNEEEVLHYLLPRDGVTFTYVVHRGNVITDFFSFYSLPSTVIGNSKYNQLYAAYTHYYAATTVPLTQLMNDLLIVAHNHGFDVCNMVDILENGSIVSECKFGPGDGNLNYYFYNWSYPKISSSQVGLVML